MSLWDVDALIAQVRRLTFAPNSATTGTADSDLLKILTEGLHVELVPLLRRAQEEHFVTYTDTALVSGQNNYQMPARAVANSLRDIWLLNSNGDPTYPPLVRMDLPDVPKLVGTPATQGFPERFYLRGNEIILWPTPSIAASLRLHYEMLPAYLCATSSTATVVSLTSTTVTISSALFANAAKVDFVQATPPFRTLGFDAVVQSGGNTTTLTFTSGVIPSLLAVGDYVCPRWQAPVAQIPQDFHGLLVHYAARLVLKALGDLDKLSAEQAEAARALENVRVLVTPRVPGRPKTLGVSPWG